MKGERGRVEVVMVERKRGGLDFWVFFFVKFDVLNLFIFCSFGVVF